MEDKSNYKHYENISITLQMLMYPFEAESTAFWVAGMLGLDTSDYSFGYIAGWSKDREITELKENLDLIKRTADGLVSKVDDYLKQQTEEKEQAVVPEIAPVSKRHR